MMICFYFSQPDKRQGLWRCCELISTTSKITIIFPITTGQFSGEFFTVYGLLLLYSVRLSIIICYPSRHHCPLSFLVQTVWKNDRHVSRCPFFKNQLWIWQTWVHQSTAGWLARLTHTLRESGGPYKELFSFLNCHLKGGLVLRQDRPAWISHHSQNLLALP